MEDLLIDKATWDKVYPHLSANPSASIIIISDIETDITCIYTRYGNYLPEA